MTPHEQPSAEADVSAPADTDLTRDAQSAAFFDVDNTMMIGASIFHFAKGLAARDLFSWRDLATFTVKQARLRIQGERHGDLHRARDSALAFVAGKSVAEIVMLGEEIYDEEMSDRIWPGTYALAQYHLNAGQRVWLVTATPVELATIIARRLNLTGALGTVAESQDGVYTGRLVGEALHGAAKADAVAALAAREGLELDKCSAYSDSINDLPLLSMVGHAVAVNPDSALRAEAKRQGWEIRDFRTGRKAAMIGVPTALGVGAVGGVAAAFAVRQARREAAGYPAVTVPRRGFSASSRFSARSTGAARAAGRAWSGSFRVLGR
jgi:HAD superfamily hydrolase (TIGR01490 family)